MADTDREMSIERKALYVPQLEELCTVLKTGLSNNFENIEVSVVDCPDLTQPPFNLAAPGVIDRALPLKSCYKFTLTTQIIGRGICGSPRLAEVGGVPYLLPTAQRDKVYNMDRVTKQMDLPGALILGAGAGFMCNSLCELVFNTLTTSDCTQGKHQSWAALLSPDSGEVRVKQYDTKEFVLLSNLFASEGKPGKVVEVKASKRKSDENFVSKMRQTLNDRYGEDRAVGIGGSFLIEKGKAHLHVMPHFPKTPLNSDEDVNKWLHFREMSAPLVCNSVFVSNDPGLDVRLEHTHCFSDHSEGGHYHRDTTPDEVVYRGYFVPAEWLYRIDRPLVTHNIGRD